MRPMTPTTALLWRQWRETRVALIAGLLLTIAITRGLAAVQASQEAFAAPEVVRIAIFLIAFVTIAVGLAVIFSHANEKRLTTTMTAQWLALPVRSTALAKAILGYRLLLMLVVVILALVAFHTTLGAPIAEGENMSWDAVRTGAALERGILSMEGAGVYLLLATALFMGVQAIEWTIRPWSALFAWLAHGGVVAALLYLINDAFLQRPETWIGLTASIPLSVTIATVGLAVHRNGALQNFRVPLTFSGARTKAYVFRTPDEALRWFEWRSGGVWYVAFSSTIAALLFLGTLYQWIMGDIRLQSAVHVPDAPIQFAYAALAGPLTVALVGGLVYTLARRGLMTGGASASFAALPVSTKRLAVAGLRNGLKSTALIGAIVVAFTLSLAQVFATTMSPYSIGEMWRYLFEPQFYVWIFIFLCLAFVLFQAGLFLIALYGFVTLLIILAAALYPELMTDAVIRQSGLAAYIVSSALLVAYCTAFAIRRGHLTIKTAALGLLLPTAFAPMPIYLYLTIGPDLDYPIEGLAMCIVAILTFAAPFALWPAYLYLTWLRTR